uniref:Alpha/beta hydrolase fold-3 domain-containing protein n=1 Tax=Chromera velia CCMP2878 TaxID=1169474 RepID=A0A0G4I923_9ALVE|mmetsp:Transcript_1740/g.3602  ORF Transcript_1740/g.3602 Transcript_1740/m.3602 type:complete len:499 (+) Transcript_1740:125-1621(+)|eukprot:Cvel_12113.t1-p1 / transcript=Cvel_12113.t1 / gene=Cvel_12113 / organism=Chromera_velia_CCMP2878 / gene_product=Monoterpene epsilon-lactone hydrolase, putative / transcript_product=Monoterpene epsilon-lactone hydrolase, putative / location=Cvel_scaffold780:38478-39971(+) / protein_length=498 / sequence_SO=supercontig / SO=protein_coding / is_pseudo=false
MCCPKEGGGSQEGGVSLSQTTPKSQETLMDGEGVTVDASSTSRSRFSSKRNVLTLAAFFAVLASLFAFVAPYPVSFYAVRTIHELIILKVKAVGWPDWMDGRQNEEMSWEFRSLAAMLFWHNEKDLSYNHPKGVDLMRAEVDRMATLAPLHKQAKVQLVDADGSPAALIDVSGAAQPSQNLREGTLVYFHGGGYSMGSMNAYLGIGTEMALSLGLTRALVVEYPRLPEAGALPDVIDAAFASYLWLLKKLEETGSSQGGKIVFAGDSAGGALCLYVMQHAQAHSAATGPSVRLPDAAVLLSPWVWPGAHSTAPSLLKFRESDAFCRPRVSEWIMTLFVQSNKELMREEHREEEREGGEKKEISAHFPQLAGGLQRFNLLAAAAEGRLGADLPPMFVSVGGGELLLDMGVEFARLLEIPSVPPSVYNQSVTPPPFEEQVAPCVEAAGRAGEGKRAGDCLSVVPHMPHIFQCFPAFAKEARGEHARIGAWFRSLDVEKKN